MQINDQQSKENKITVIKHFMVIVAQTSARAIKTFAFCLRKFKQKESLRQILKKLKNKKPLIGAFLLGLMLIVFIMVLAFHKPKQQNKIMKTNKQVIQTITNDYLGKQLEDMAIKLANIQKELTKNTGVLDLDPIKEQIQQLTTQTRNLSDKSDKLISAQIQDSTKQVKTELNIIKAKLTILQREKQKIAYLKPADLPFNIISLDNIQQNNVVTVNYDYQIIPINIGDYLAGWKLINADFADQKAEFINQKNQHVIVDLNHLDIQDRSSKP